MQPEGVRPARGRMQKVKANVVGTGVRTMLGGLLTRRGSGEAVLQPERSANWKHNKMPNEFRQGS